MNNTKRTLLSSLFLTGYIFVMTAQPTNAVTFIDCDFNTPPSSENEGGEYSCNTGSMSFYFGSNLSGPVFDHAATDGWHGSGAAKFYTHIGAESYGNSYRQMNPSAFTSNLRQNISFLIKLGPGMAGEMGGKWHIKEWAPAWRTWIGYGSHASPLDAIQPDIAYNNTEWMAHGDGASLGDCSSSGYQCCHIPETWTDPAISSCLRTESTVFDWSDHENQWVALEIERTSLGVVTLYIWTQDGEFNGKYYEVDTIFDNDDLGNSPIGAYLEGENYTGKHFLIDEVQYSDSFIGPPEGFGDIDTTPPSLPVGLTIL